MRVAAVAPGEFEGRAPDTVPEQPAAPVAAARPGVVEAALETVDEDAGAALRLAGSDAGDGLGGGGGHAGLPLRGGQSPSLQSHPAGRACRSVQPSVELARECGDRHRACLYCA